MSSSEDEGIDVKRGRGALTPVEAAPLDPRIHDESEDDYPPDVRIKKIVFDKSEKIAVASFQSLGVPLSSKFSSSKSEMFSIKGGILTAPEEAKMKHILATEIPLPGGKTFRYEGSTPYEADDTYSTWAAVLNKETGEATLYPADVFHMMPCSAGYGDHPWRLRMHIPPNVTPKEDEKAAPVEEDEATKKKNAAAKMRMKSQNLSDAFGTTAKQRRKKQMGENRLTSTAGSALELDQILKAAPAEDHKPVSQAMIPGDEFGILPRLDLSASSPRDVVAVEDLIPTEVGDLILGLPDVDKIVQRDEDQFQEWKKCAAFPNWFLTSLKTLSVDEERRKRQAMLLFYAWALFNIVKARADDIRKKTAGFPDSWPFKLLNHFLRNFTQENVSAANPRRRNRVMPTVLKDKAILHSVFVLLIANDFCFAASEFFSELGCQDSRMASLCNLGRLGHYKRLNELWIELRTPLPEYKDAKDDRGSRKRRQ